MPDSFSSQAAQIIDEWMHHPLIGKVGQVAVLEKLIATALTLAHQQGRVACEATHLTLEDKWHKAGYADGQAMEREECAKVADEFFVDERERSKGATGHGHSLTLGYQDACTDIAAAIRGRVGEEK